jgi:hypothetical protein
MHTQSAFLNLSDFIGGELEHVIPFDIFSIKPDIALETYKSWFNFISSGVLKKECEYLCFLDFTLSDRNLENFFGFVATNSKFSYKTYTDTIRELISYDNKDSGQVENRTVGSHRVFQSGLPVFENGVSPLNYAELNKYIGKYKVSKERILFFEIHDDSHSSIPNGKVEKKSFYMEFLSKTSVGHKADSYSYKEDTRILSEKYSVDENWLIFCSILEDKKVHLQSNNGGELSLVIGIPVCVHNIDSSMGYIPIAQIFLGFSGNLDEAYRHAQNVIKVLVLHAFRSNAPYRARIIGETYGKLQARSHAAHEMRNIVKDMGKWILSPSCTFDITHTNSPYGSSTKELQLTTTSLSEKDIVIFL